jgi:hypothetical protein|nr:MAG TPA: Deoxyribodipyrimidine photo-lyase-related protein [Caudoviricetes sp.]
MVIYAQIRAISSHQTAMKKYQKYLKNVGFSMEYITAR